MNRLSSHSISVSVSESRSAMIRPGAYAADRRDAVFQHLLQHQPEEAAEHVAANGLVEFVENRPRCEQTLASIAKCSSL
jgi:phosphopantothenoylcysteine synthetase/decarboxylase